MEDAVPGLATNSVETAQSNKASDSIRNMHFRRLPLLVRSLSVKIALGVAGVLAALMAAVGFLDPGGPGWGMLMWPALTAAMTYLVVNRLVVRRINLAHTTLKQIRDRRFTELEAAQVPRGDELNALLWQVYRTGRATEKEITELKRIENYRREFLGNVSHELKTPIFTVQGFAETLLSGALDDARVNRKFVEIILKNALRLGNLANDLSEIARIETGELKMTSSPFQIGRLIQEVVEGFQLAAEAKAVAVRADVPDSLPAVLGDRERLRQVLTNLVDNGIKYNNPGGFVEVSVSRASGSEIRVSVVDDGIGVSAQHIPRLTERFFRVDKSRSRDEGGTGLGLAISKHILAAHDRRLTIESEPGKGSSFSFTLAMA